MFFKNEKVSKQTKLDKDTASGFLGGAKNILLVVCVVLAGYILFKGYMINQSPIELKAVETEESEVAFNRIVFPERQDFTMYADAMKKRDIFDSPYGKKRPSRTEKISTEGVFESSDLGSKYKLVGVVLDKDPLAIVKSFESKETLFLSVGDEMGNAVLEEIKENQVIFRYNNKRVSLTADKTKGLASEQNP